MGRSRRRAHRLGRRPDDLPAGGAGAGVTIALPTSRHAPRGISLERRRIPPELVQPYGPLRLTHPSLTAVDLVSSRSLAAVVDEVPRTGAATLHQLWTALELTPNRRGNTTRR